MFTLFPEEPQPKEAYRAGPFHVWQKQPLLFFFVKVRRVLLVHKGELGQVMVCHLVQPNHNLSGKNSLCDAPPKKGNK